MRVCRLLQPPTFLHRASLEAHHASHPNKMTRVTRRGVSGRSQEQLGFPRTERWETGSLQPLPPTRAPLSSGFTHLLLLVSVLPPPPPRQPLPLQGPFKHHGASLKSSPRLGPPLTQSGDRGLPPPHPSQPPESPQPPNGLFPQSTFSLETETSALQGAPEDWGRPVVQGAGPPRKHSCSRGECPPTSQVRHCPRRTRTWKQLLAVLLQGFSRL